MKKLLIGLMLTLTAFCSAAAIASSTGKIGVVDMQKIFRTSPAAKTINKSLEHEFSARKANIINMGKALQADVQKYQKNHSVMDKKAVLALQQKINKQSLSLRKAQAKLQSDWIAEQGVKEKAFIANIKAAVSTVAKKESLELVFPNNAVLYSNGDVLDITKTVISDMK